MAWTIVYKDSARKQLKKLDRPTSERIVRFLEERVLGRKDPYSVGKTLEGDFAGAWCYRVGDYRVLCDMEDDRLIVYVVRIGHRREVYK